MAVPFKLPRRVPSRIREYCEVETYEEAAKTLVTPKPSFDPEDDVLPDLDEEKGLPLPEAPSEQTREAARPRGSAGWASSASRLAKESAVVQLVLLSILGMLVLALLFGPGEPADPTPFETDPPATFPKIEIDGAPPVTEEEIARRLRMPATTEETQAAETGLKEEAEDPDAAKRAELKAMAALGRKKVGIEGPPEKRRLAAGGRRSDELVARAVTVRGEQSGVLRSAWFTPGGTVKIEGIEEKEPPRLPLGVGDRLFAKLEVGISSGHSAPVLARLRKDVRAAGRLVAPKGSMLKGRFRSDSFRIYVTFDELILASGKRLRFAGYAVDQKVPGLVATRREVDPEDAGGAVLEETVDVAKDVALSVASGSIVGRVARGVADGAVPEQEKRGKSGFILEVPAGKRFEVVVTSGAQP